MADNNGTKNVQATPELKNYLEAQANQLADQVGRMTVAVIGKENKLNQKEMQLRGTAGPGNWTTDNRMTKLPFYLAPGNVGDINKVIWPFVYPTTRATVPAQGNANASFSVTQEAAFIAVSYMKTVFLLTEEDAGPPPVPFNVQYMDPNIPGNKATGLRFSFRDLQSTREFTNLSIDVDHVGNPRFPTKLPAPMLIMPRANVQVSYTNSSDNIYVVFMSFVGVRIRIEDAYNILSTVTEGQ